MPLSEYEQRVLREMEQHLRADDPSLAESMQAPTFSPRIDVKRLSLGILVSLVGVVALVAGVATDLWWLGIIGFLGMFSGVLLATTRGHGGERKPDVQKRPVAGPRKGGRSSFMDRQQERWERRNDTD